MSLTKIKDESIKIATEDGCELSARWWPGRQASEYSLVFLPAIAAPQLYLRWIASYLAECGWGVLTFDYRGIGASKNTLRDRTITLDDWVNLDIPAAIAEVKLRNNPTFLAVVAHSIGGQLLGQSPACKYIDGAVFISAQRGIPNLFKGWARLRIHYAYTIFPVLIKMLENLPVSKWTLPQHCPRLVLLQWIKWGNTGVITDTNGANVEPKFAQFDKAITTIKISDDSYYASSESVEALTRLYQNAIIKREVIVPANYELNTIGHFGLFHRRTPHKLWFQIDQYLKEMINMSYSKH